MRKFSHRHVQVQSLSLYSVGAQEDRLERAHHVALDDVHLGG